MGLLLPAANHRHSSARTIRLTQFGFLITNTSDIQIKFCENALKIGNLSVISRK